MQSISTQEKQVLFHTLGINYRDEAFRNYFVAGSTHSDMPTIISLIRKGLMCAGGTSITSYEQYFYVTEAGKIIARKLKKEEITSRQKLTRSQKRYRNFLSCGCSNTFGECLKSGCMGELERRRI